MAPSAMRPAIGLAIAGVICLSCGGSGGNRGGGTGGGGTGGGGGGTSDGVNVSASTRLAWSQVAPNRAALGAYQFVAYVDGTRSTLADVRCGDTSAAGGFECTSAMPSMTPGRHVLELATIGGGEESARSAQLVLNRLASQAASAASEVRPPVVVPDRVCVEGAADECFDVDVVADGLTAPDHLAVLPGERAMFVDADRRAAIVDLETGAIEPALAAHGDAGRLVGIAVDPAFEETRFVFVAVVSEERRLSVVRLREVANRLGEAATVVPDLPVSPDGWPAITMDAARRIVIAMPLGDARDPYAGHVLRFTESGRAAGHVATNSPILAMGPGRPAVVAVDSKGRLWVGASGEPAGQAVTVLPAEPGDGGRWPSAGALLGFEPTTWPEGAEGVRGLAFDAGNASGDTRQVYVVIEHPHALFAGPLDAAGAGVGALRSLDLDALEPRAVAATPSGDLLVAAGTRILRLRKTASAVQERVNR